MSNSPPDRFWNGTFILVCTAQFFGSAQHALLQPTFPLLRQPTYLLEYSSFRSNIGFSSTVQI
jgi:hypothetical protein